MGAGWGVRCPEQLLGRPVELHPSVLHWLERPGSWRQRIVAFTQHVHRDGRPGHCLTARSWSPGVPMSAACTGRRSLALTQAPLRRSHDLRQRRLVMLHQPSCSVPVLGRTRELHHVQSADFAEGRPETRVTYATPIAGSWPHRRLQHSCSERRLRAIGAESPGLASDSSPSASKGGQLD